MEKILKIEEIEFYVNKWCTEIGYKITTTQQEIFVLIDNFQCCCESFGYLTTNDNINDFVGSNLFDIKLTDTSLNTKLLEKEFPYGFDEGGIQFVDLNTSNGALQLAVYNSHNGYYGHSIRITSRQLNYKGSL